jgi:hypothetical protein
LLEINSTLLHVLNDDNSLMIGNGGWSYTINRLTSASIDQLNYIVPQTHLKDSMAFQGRTPCGIPNASKSQLCYKLKWYLVLYGDAGKNEPLTYRVYGTGFRLEAGRRGKWKIIAGKDGRTIYELLDESGKPLFNLIKLDEGILIFTDEKGNLLVGDHDFSYTLNRKF